LQIDGPPRVHQIDGRFLALVTPLQSVFNSSCLSLNRLLVGAQDCHGGSLGMAANVLPKEIEEGDEGDAISSRRWLQFYMSGCTKPLLEQGGERA